MVIVLFRIAADQSRSHARRRSDRRHDADFVAETRAVDRSGGKNREIYLQRTAAACLWRIRTSSSGGVAPPPRQRRFSARARRSLRKDLPKDRLDDAGAAERYRALPARVLYGGTRIP